MGPARKIALITGSTSGIGLNIAQKLAKAGNSVVLTGRGEQKDIFHEILDFKKQYHNRVTFVHGDLTNTESVSELCKDVTNIHSRGVDILINNAGLHYTRPIEKHCHQTWQDMLAVHLTAPFLLTQHFLPYMKRKGWGRIVNISAIHGMVGRHSYVSFCASKAGLIGLTKANKEDPDQTATVGAGRSGYSLFAKTVALEADQYGVTCNAVCPSSIDTEGAGTTLGETDYIEKDMLDAAQKLFLTDSNTAFNPATREQVANMVFHLCTEDARDINGGAIPVYGGMEPAS